MEHIQTPLESHPPTQLQPMPSGKKFWTMRKGFIALAIFGCITFLILMSYLAYQFIRGKKSVSEIPEVLLNQPLYDFTGNIEQITGSQITVSEKSVTYPTELNNEETNFSLKEKKQTYIITVSDQTKIISTLPVVPYSLKLATDSAVIAESNLERLKVGQRVFVTSKENLRALQSNSFVADSITVSAGLTSIMGKVGKLENSTMLLKVAPPAFAEERDFQITISDDTEIVTSDIMKDSSDITKKKTQLPISTLTEGTTVLVYTDADINQNNNMNALKVEVIKGF